MTDSTLLQDLQRTSDQVFSQGELERKLKLGRPLRIKYGVDITAPFLHIGHAVNLWMMRRLQEEGHRVLFLLGDYTTRIGDPTGKSAARKVPTDAEIEANAQAFIDQCGQILLTDPAVFEVRRNSEWFGPMGATEFLSLLAMVTHGRLIQRDMFQARIAEQKEIWMHELLYPVLQGYDSFMLNSDLTIVGSDQLFNEMMGRFFQERLGQPPQVVLTSKITPGTDGVQKQSKTLGNYIALADTPRDKFGKVMRIPDTLIAQYLEVYTTLPLDHIKARVGQMQTGGLNPRDLKLELAAAIVTRYHGEAAGAEETAWFRETFSQRQQPVDAPAARVTPGPLLDVMVACQPELSRSEARRLLRAGAVGLDERRLSDEHEQVDATAEGQVLRLGKRRWFKLTFHD